MPKSDTAPQHSEHASAGKKEIGKKKAAATSGEGVAKKKTAYTFRKFKKGTSLKSYMNGVLKLGHPKYTLTSQSRIVSDDFSRDFTNRLTDEALNLCDTASRKVIDARHVEGAMKIIIRNPSLMKKMLTSGERAYSRYRASLS